VSRGSFRAYNPSGLQHRRTRQVLCETVLRCWKPSGRTPGHLRVARRETEADEGGIECRGAGLPVVAATLMAHRRYWRMPFRNATVVVRGGRGGSLESPAAVDLHHECSSERTWGQSSKRVLPTGRVRCELRGVRYRRASVQCCRITRGTYGSDSTIWHVPGTSRRARRASQPFFRSGGGTGPRRIRRTDSSGPGRFRISSATVGPVGSVEPGNRQGDVDTVRVVARWIKATRGRRAERRRRPHRRRKPLKGEPHGRHRHETGSEGFREERSARRLRKPEGVA